MIRWYWFVPVVGVAFVLGFASVFPICYWQEGVPLRELWRAVKEELKRKPG